MIESFEDFVNESKKPKIEVSVRHAREAGDAFKDTPYSKQGKMTATNMFQFKKAEDAEEFAEYLMDYVGIPEDEITGYNLDESYLQLNEDNTRSHNALVKKMAKMQDAFYKSLVAEIKKVYPPGNYSMGEDWYPGLEGGDFNTANNLVNTLIEKGYIKVDNPSDPSESLIKYK